MVERYSVDNRRFRLLQPGMRGKGPVVYWMNRDQRIADNWALLHAQDIALQEERGLCVVFCLQQKYLRAGANHFHFMLKGLEEMAVGLKKLNISFFLLRGSPENVLPAMIVRLDAHSLVTDFNPLKIKKQWQERVAADVSVPLYEVDAHNIIPCWYASPKKEYAAYTFRPKVQKLLPEFLIEFPKVRQHPFSVVSENEQLDRDGCRAGHGDAGDGGQQVPYPGERAGTEALSLFLAKRLEGYDENRNNPLVDGQSGLSVYFHFGQLSPQRAALEVRKAKVNEESKESFLEELIVRRELSDNYCYYCSDYDTIEGFPEWAQKTLLEHRQDVREYIYSEEEFLSAATHEPLWNCCQQMLARNGRLHGYLRMYWAKKILEWSESPEEAQRIAIMLNDMFAFDGRDPNGYTGVAWSVGGVHDRAWPERQVYGKIRYMNENGCRRKFAVDTLLQQWRQITRGEKKQ